MKKLLFLATTLSAAIVGAIILAGGKPTPVYQGKPIRAWVEQLASSDYQLRDQAVEAMQVIGPQATPQLIRALHAHDLPFQKLTAGWERRLPFLPFKPQPNTTLLRERAAEQLGLSGRTNETVIRALVSALDEQDRNVLSEVQRALRRVDSVPYLVKALRNGNRRVRQGVAEVLIDLAPQTGPVLAALVQALKDRDDLVRARAAQALGGIGQMRRMTRQALAPELFDAKVVEALKLALEDRMPAVRRAAAESLGRIGPPAREAGSVLTQRLSDTDIGVRVAAAKSLWQIEGVAEKVVPVLIDALKDRTVGWQAPFVLGQIGGQAESAVPALIEAMKQERVSRPLRSPPSSAFALGQIGAAAVPELIEALRDERPYVRTAAAIGLGFIGPSARRAVPALRPLLRDKHLEVRQASGLALATIEPQLPELSPVLVELTQDEDIFISSAAASALRKNNPTLAKNIGLE